jgi:hypothetical protein
VLATLGPITCDNLVTTLAGCSMNGWYSIPVSRGVGMGVGVGMGGQLSLGHEGTGTRYPQLDLHSRSSRYAALRDSTASATVQVKSSPFWDVTQRRLVVTDVSGQPIGPIFRSVLTVVFALKINVDIDEVVFH